MDDKLLQNAFKTYALMDCILKKRKGKPKLMREVEEITEKARRLL